MSLRGKSACTELFLCSSSRFCPSFKGEEGQPSLPAIRDPPLPRHWRRMKLAVDLADELERDRPLFARVGRERE